MAFLNTWKWLHFQEAKDQERHAGFDHWKWEVSIDTFSSKVRMFFLRKKHVHTEVVQSRVHCDTGNYKHINKLRKSQEGIFLPLRAQYVGWIGWQWWVEHRLLLPNRTQNTFFSLWKFALCNLLGREVCAALQHWQNALWNDEGYRGHLNTWGNDLPLLLVEIVYAQILVVQGILLQKLWFL